MRGLRLVELGISMELPWVYYLILILVVTYTYSDHTPPYSAYIFIGIELHMVFHHPAYSNSIPIKDVGNNNNMRTPLPTCYYCCLSAHAYMHIKLCTFVLNLVYMIFGTTIPISRILQHLNGNVFSLYKVY